MRRALARRPAPALPARKLLGEAAESRDANGKDGPDARRRLLDRAAFDRWPAVLETARGLVERAATTAAAAGRGRCAPAAPRA